ncbi:ABC transporter ATP-binding protein [Serratia fonticola]|uniref:ABC transporter ATP-binding protein n=1 Tax=Serratia fonticola TaxID=47917 RepID=UPI003AAB1ACC
MSALQINTSLSLDRVIKSYGNHQVIKEISFTVHPGEFICLLGPNGAGKTTLLEMILGIRTVDKGMISVLGQQSSQLDQKMRARMGVVLQSQGLPVKLKVSEYLKLIVTAYNIHAKKSDLSEKLDIDQLWNTKIGQLSGGQLRKVVVYAALLSKPELLIMDEPTSSLDPYARLCVWNDLKRLCLQSTRPSAVLLSSHDMREATELSDKVLIVHQGSIVAQGTPKQLINEHCPKHQISVPIKNMDLFKDKLSTIDDVLRPSLISELSVDGAHVVYTKDRLAQVTKLIGNDSFAIERQREYMPTLEDVFIAVTGVDLN